MIPREGWQCEQQKEVQEMKPDNSWIVEVISDIQTYALENGLHGLAEQLEGAGIVALAEINEETGKQELADSRTSQ